MGIEKGSRILVLHNLHNPLNAEEAFSEYTVESVSDKDVKTDRGTFYLDFCRLATDKNKDLLYGWVTHFINTNRELQSMKFKMLNELDK